MLDPNNSFFTADTHFGHDELYGHKGMRKEFKNSDEGDAHMIDKWNEVVPPGGAVIHVGDFTFGRAGKRGLDYWKEISSQLNGTIILILGNHDDCLKVPEILSLPKFVWAGVRRRLTVIDPTGNVQRKNQPSYQEIVVDHFPLRVWDKKRYGSWHLHGHMHNSIPPFDLSFDVGVDTNDFKPYTYAQVKAKMASLNARQRQEVRQPFSPRVHEIGTLTPKAMESRKHHE